MVSSSLEHRLEVELRLSQQVVEAGTALPVHLTVIAREPVDVVEVVVELVRTDFFRYRQGNVYGGAYTAKAHRSETVRRVVVATTPSPGERPETSSDTSSDTSSENTVLLDVPPDAAGSVDGQLIEITWAVAAVVRPRHGRVAESAKPIRVLGRALPVEGEVDEPVLERTDFADLSVASLSTRRLVPGSLVAGTLTVVPRASGTVETALAELVLLEHVVHGPWDQSDPGHMPEGEDRMSETALVASVLAENLALEVGRSVSLPFLLLVPAPLPAPSLSTPNFTIRWQLRLSLARRLHRPSRLLLAMQAQTAPCRPA